MLHFQGIRTNRLGVPERFSIHYDLRASLEALLVIVEHHQGEAEPVLDSIQASLDDHLRFSAPQGQARFEHRRTTAQWFRARDMARFLFEEPGLVRLKLKVFKRLSEPRPIEDKWQLVKEELAGGIVELEPNYAHRQLLEPCSGLHRLIDSVALFFLEQDEELPPMNLEMEFVKNDFPRRVWRRKDALSPGSAPFWVPKNQLCDALVLQQLVLERIFEERVSQALDAPRQTAGELWPEPGGPVGLRFEDQSDQLDLIPQSPAETLLMLQREVQRRHSFEGSKHLLAVMRQLGEAQSSRFRFDCKAHFELLGRLKQGHLISERQQGLLDDTLSALERVKVRREAAQETLERPLLSVWGKVETERGPGALELLLDPVLFGGLGLGRQLALLPREIFLESTQTHGMVPGLMAYLTGWWLVQYHEKNGVFQCRADKLIEAFTLKKSTAQKAKFQAKIKSELNYMAQKAYISSFEIRPDPNPFEEEYRITAPAALLESFNLHAQPALNA